MFITPPLKRKVFALGLQAVHLNLYDTQTTLLSGPTPGTFVQTGR